MHIGLVFSLHSHTVTVTFTILLESVECIIESLPLVARVTDVASLRSMEVNHLVQLVLQQIEVETDLSLNLRAIDQHQELRFVSSVKEEFKMWGGIAVNLDVMEAGIIVAEVLIILFDFLADWIPSSMEVQACKFWLLLVEVLNTVLETLWLDVVVSMHRDDTSNLLIND